MKIYFCIITSKNRLTFGKGQVGGRGVSGRGGGQFEPKMYVFDCATVTFAQNIFRSNKNAAN